MIAYDVTLRALAADLKIALIFYTRLPLVPPGSIEGADVARAGWAAPVVGAILGLFGALVYWLAFAVGLPGFAAAGLALAATIAATGALHEDGLADTADGFGGGATRESKLEIMRDSRLGVYGACALILSLLLRASAIASLSHPALVALALIAAHTSARAPIPLFMQLVPRARVDGLSAQVGPSPKESTLIAALFGIIALALGLGLLKGFIALFLLMLAIAFMSWLSIKQIGGQTGDVIGALEQINEILILLVGAARI
jgi:adenosylcobinamide-GDP ribazoletransferase